MSWIRPFTGMALDRASVERKDPARVAELLADPRAAAVAGGRDQVLIEAEGPALLHRVPVASVPALPGEPILLGVDGDVPLFAVDLEAVPEVASDGARIVPLREAGLTLPSSEGGLAAYAVALLNWHRTHRFCANCGSKTVVTEAGHTRRCPRCGRDHFPRTDPVVIMSVSCGDQLLLGRRAGWPHRTFSVLAGFVSPGESVEEAVVREVQEESGIVARDPQFVASQPWPFPASLMLGFAAESDGGEPVAGDEELEEVRWFSVAEIRDALAGRSDSLHLPPPVAIARWLIERWVMQQSV